MFSYGGWKFSYEHTPDDWKIYFLVKKFFLVNY